MRNRTADLLLTMETLCLLSYRGAQMPLDGQHQRTKIHTGRRPERIRAALLTVPAAKSYEWVIRVALGKCEGTQTPKGTLVTSAALAPIVKVRI
jgi:hypothetical protein